MTPTLALLLGCGALTSSLWVFTAMALFLVPIVTLVLRLTLTLTLTLTLFLVLIVTRVLRCC